MKMARRNLNLTDELIEKLKKEAYSKHRTYAGLIRAIVRCHYNKELNVDEELKKEPRSQHRINYE